MEKKLDYNRPQFTVNYVDFPDIKDYTIVYPADIRQLRVLARYLKNFFKSTAGIELKIVSDASACSDKEILIGDTNRRITTLSKKDFAVSVADDRLVFEGGHTVMVEKAVKWFMTLDFRAGKIATLKGCAEDFEASVFIDGEEYSYVWGDEFDGDFFDRTRFTQHYHMPNRAPSACVLVGENDTLRVQDGLLKMSSINYTDPENSEIKYAIPECVCTDDTMWWLYGYAEIRAKVPMKKGSWPAWWATSYCDTTVGKTEGWKYLVEIDFFEVFSNEKLIQPNIHKWFKNYAGTFTELYDEKGEEMRHSGYADLKLPCKNFEMPPEEKDGYHTYGFKWTPDEMVLSVDGVDYMKYDLNYNFDNTTDMEDMKKRPLHMIFDNWIYAPGGWMAWEGNWTSPESLPSEFFVEYVRLYQKPGEGYVRMPGLDKEI